MLKIFETALKIIILFGLLISQTLTYAQNESQKSSAVWAWEVTSEKRKIYLLGELHRFIRLKNKTIDYQLGNDVYQVTSEIFTEFDGSATEKNPSDTLSQLLGSKTWGRMKIEITDVFNELSIKNSEDKNSFLEKIFKEIDLSSAYSAYKVINVTVAATSLKKFPDFFSQRGFGENLKKIERISYEKKHSYIEDSNALSEGWANNCSDSYRAQTLVNAALDNLATAKIKEFDSLSKVQDLFLTSNGSLDELMSTLVEKEEGQIIRDCVITPRNYMWLPKLKQSLETSGPPIMFLVGIGHVGGNEGLIALLQKEGYTDIKRIYSVK
jgi:TraB/PrgY/gumN family